MKDGQIQLLVGEFLGNFIGVATDPQLAVQPREFLHQGLERAAGELDEGRGNVIEQSAHHANAHRFRRFGLAGGHGDGQSEHGQGQAGASQNPLRHE